MKMKHYYKIGGLLLCLLLLVQLLPAAAAELVRPLEDNPLYVGEAPGAGFEMVFALDTSAAMRQYDYNKDDGWMDAYTGLMQQSPEGAQFGVVTDSTETPLSGAETADAALRASRQYTGTADILGLLKKAAAVFTDSANQKMVVLSTASCYNYSEIHTAVSAMRQTGITVLWIAYENDPAAMETAQAADDTMILCGDVTDLAFQLSDTYDAMLDFKYPQQAPAAMSLSATAPIVYESAYRPEKHSFSFSAPSELKAGYYLAEVLNMYYQMPANDSACDLFDTQKVSAESSRAVAFGDSHSITFMDTASQQSFLTTWNTRAGNLIGTVYTAAGQATESAVESVLRGNLRRRMPVILWSGDAKHLITGWYESNGTVTLTTAENTELSLSALGEVTVLDTHEYLREIKTTCPVTRSVVQTPYGFTVTLTLPAAYTDADVNVTVGEPSVTVKMTSQTDRYTVVQISAAWDLDFTVGVKVYYGTYLPNCSNATFQFNSQQFVDVTGAEWGFLYIRDMVDRGIVNGTYDESKRAYVFEPEKNIIIAQFVKIVLTAIGINLENGDDTNPDYQLPPYNSVDIDCIWAIPHLKYAYERGWITAEQIISSHEAIQRQEAADIIWQAFMSEDCTTTHQLIEYQRDAADISQRTADWDSGKFTDQSSISSVYENAMFQLYVNEVLTGYEDNTLKPAANITRQEACTIVYKCLVNATDSNINKDELDKIMQDHPLVMAGQDVTGQLNEYGGMTYRCQIPQTGLYTITTDNNTDLTVYRADNETPIYQKAGADGVYPIYGAQEVLLSVTGPASSAFNLSVSSAAAGSTDKGEKTVHIVLYDSAYEQAYQPASTAPEKVYRYYDSDGNRFQYSTDLDYDHAFFENYLQLCSGQEVTFAIQLRDLWFDGVPNTDYPFEGDNILSADYAAQASAVQATTIQYVNAIVDSIAQAYQNLTQDGVPAALPSLFIATPDFRCNVKEEQLADYTQTYMAVTQSIYQAVAANASAQGVPVAGLYFGKEDPYDYDMNDIASRTQRTLMQEVAKYAHAMGKQVIWMPYTAGGVDELTKIGKVANVGLAVNDQQRYEDLCDIIILQPGYFYSEVTARDETIVNNIRLLMQNDIRQSVSSQKVTLNGAVVGGEKLTNTRLFYQVEYDSSLITGREAAGTANPQDKYIRLLETITTFKDWIIDSSTSFGIYSGGPNEQDYAHIALDGAEPGQNQNRHSNRNHNTLLGDDGHGVRYSEFRVALSQEYQDGRVYDVNLISDITRGLLQNRWSVSVLRFLGFTIADGQTVAEKNEGNIHLRFEKADGAYYQLTN